MNLTAGCVPTREPLGDNSVLIIILYIWMFRARCLFDGSYVVAFIQTNVTLIASV